MDVHSKAVAQEMRRRRLGRPELLSSLDRSAGSTWLPGELAKVPTPLLVLAAVSLARPPDA